jgi:hypothetical protein
VDENHALTNAMFRRRLAGYRELNYTIEMPPGDSPAWFSLEEPTLATAPPSKKYELTEQQAMVVAMLFYGWAAEDEVMHGVPIEEVTPDEVKTELGWVMVALVAENCGIPTAPRQFILNTSN